MHLSCPRCAVDYEFSEGTWYQMQCGDERASVEAVIVEEEAERSALRHLVVHLPLATINAWFGTRY